MSSLSLRIPDDLESRLEDEARHDGVARSEIARAAIEEYLDRRERERFLAAFVAEARATYENPSTAKEMRSLADEALPFDNEALARVEARRTTRGQPRQRKRSSAQ